MNHPDALAHEPLLAGTIYDEQIKLERQSISEGVARYRRYTQLAVERGSASSLKPVERLIGYWMPAVAAEIKAQIKAIRGEQRRKVDGAPVYAPLVPDLIDDHDALAYLTLSTLMGKLLPHPMGVFKNYVSLAIGNAIAAEIGFRRAHELDDGTERPWAELQPHQLLIVVQHSSPRFGSSRIRKWMRQNLDEVDLSRAVMTALGDNMIWAALRTCSCKPWNEAFKRAFVIERRFVPVGDGKRRQIRFLKIAPEAIDMIEEGHAYRELLRPKYRFMLVPPFPWQEKNAGGYTSIRTPLVIRPSTVQREALKQAWTDGGLVEVADCLDAVCSPAWSIHRPNLTVVKHVAATGGGMAGIPKMEDHAYPTRPPDAKTNSSALKAYKKAYRQIRKANHGLRGERAFMHSVIAEAEFFERRDRIYCPHEFDSRGRAYCKPQPLNHQGGDLCRGLMLSAESRPMSERGRWWMWIHAANMFGHDKLDFASRHEWSLENEGRMRATAADPMSDLWWKDADKPWQFLAACMAIDDPDGLGARTPVQIDGSANALQHYVALGRDDDNAAAVNLKPLDRPSDIYTHVADKVMELVRADAKYGMASFERTRTKHRGRDGKVKEAIAIDPSKVIPYIGRSLVKQPVMTTVYGVTPAGMSRQVLNRLVEAGFPKEGVATYANYVGQKIREAMATACAKASEIMAWIRECARLVSETGQLLAWTTPLGFPVVQAYATKPRIVSAKTMMGSFSIEAHNGQPFAKMRKQCNASAPNYVHSLDGTHMLMVARACREAGIWFAAVHDCYWTHAEDMDTLARITREQFVKLHEQPLLRILHRQWVARYPNVKLPEPPAPGTYNIQTVLDCDYFFA